MFALGLQTGGGCNSCSPATPASSQLTSASYAIRVSCRPLVLGGRGRRKVMGSTSHFQMRVDALSLGPVQGTCPFVKLTLYGVLSSRRMRRSFSFVAPKPGRTVKQLRIRPPGARGIGVHCVGSQSLPLRFDSDTIEERLLRALQERRTEDAWQLHQELRRVGMLPSQVCCSRLVAQLSHKGSPSALSRAQSILVDLQNVEKVCLLDTDALGLVVMASARAGAARYALSITRVMLHMGTYPPVKVWSAVVSRLGKHPYDAPLALELFDEICNLVMVDSNSRNSARESEKETSVGPMHGEGSIAQRGKMGPDTGAFNAVLNACATAGLVKEAEIFLERMEIFKVEPDLVTFNVLIKLFAKAEEICQLPIVVQQMEEVGIMPDLSTYNSLVHAYVSLGELDEAEKVVQAMQQGSRQSQFWKDLNPSPTERSREVGQRKSTKSSQWLEKIMRKEKVPERAMKKSAERTTVNSVWRCRVKPDVRTYTTLMNGYVKKGRMKDAVQLLIAMQKEEDASSQPNEVTYTTVLSACVKQGLMDEARSVLHEMAAQKVPANLVTYNILLKGYCNAGRLSVAYELIKEMKAAGLAPDVVSYNTLINGCIHRDDNVVALEVFREMRFAGIAPSEVSYSTLMKAFARNGQPRLVAEVFEEMQQDPWMRVDVIAWNVLIDGYCRAGLMDEAKRGFTEMKEQGLHPSVATYGSLVKGYATAGKAGDALVIWKEIQERTMAKKGSEIEPLAPDGGLLDCLVDTCVRAGYFQKALEVVSCMEQEGILADKTKYKRMFIELYSNLYTSKHVSARRRAKSAEKRKAVEAFKFWLGLPNEYYQSDWRP